ncbi:BZ3500_MvSof-1268-A1-R1_Chr8-1g10029 [Microbotryum saponariae]|uniref:BZ3500_MvSof-1268-A1-R1_Chr8-1g10029 protein n=1 Tax=Microbotryum saponariae TaxID=289078 RepID=A0A2X0MG62_9BASI|nr:BZ3500_MvSof-1268-A1-R1_Chr8-1g10029 [Microbotryum saponariae]SDA08315.1 BZ3501_MvSof-1269-A2-R1_Chr8-1g09752 [Microbotryum saponariae]
MGIDNGAPFLHQSIAEEPRSLVGTATDPARLLPIDGDKLKGSLWTFCTAWFHSNKSKNLPTLRLSVAFTTALSSPYRCVHRVSRHLDLDCRQEARGRSFIDIVIARLKVLKKDQSSLQVVVILDNAKWRPKLKEATVNVRAERSTSVPDSVDVRFGDFRTKPICLSSEEVQVLQERLPQPSAPNVNSDQIHVWRVGSGMTFVMARTEADTYMCASARRGHIIDVPGRSSASLRWSRTSPGTTIPTSRSAPRSTARLSLRFQQKGKKDSRIVKNDYEHYVDGIKKPFRLSYGRPGSSEKPSRVDDLERQLRERAIAAAPAPIPSERQALIERQDVLEAIPRRPHHRQSHLATLDPQPDCTSRVLARLQEHLRKKFSCKSIRAKSLRPR